MVLIDVLEGGSVLSELLGDFWVGISPFHAQPGSVEGTDVALSPSEGWGSHVWLKGILGGDPTSAPVSSVQGS